MDEFMKLTSKAPIKPSEIPRLSSSTSELKHRINENDQDLHHHHRIYSKLQNSKKPSMEKNFMSPTISASSKATTPRKNILADSNEAPGMIFSDTHLQKRSTHASADLNSSPITKISPKVSEMEDKGIDSISQPYDPVSNLLSPRPKFLRYDPNRRSEIFHRREREMKEWKENGLSGNDTSSDSEKIAEEEVPSDADSEASSSSTSSFSEEGSKNPEDGSGFGLNDLELNPSPSREEETHESDGSSSGLKELGLNPPPSKEEETHESKKPEDGSSSGLKDLGLNPPPLKEEETHESKTPEAGSSSGLNELGLNPSVSKEEEAHENGDEEDDEIEEVEEGQWKNGYVNQVMKFLLLLLVLTLSASYISSMNSPTPTPALQALQALRDYKVEFLKIQESFVAWGGSFLDRNQEYNQNLLMEANERENVVGVNQEEMEADQVDETLELSEGEKEEAFLENEVGVNQEVVGEEWEMEAEQVDETLELGEGEKEEAFLEEILSVEEEKGFQKEEMIGELEEKSVEVSDQMVELVEVIGEELELKSVEVPDQVDEAFLEEILSVKEEEGFHEEIIGEKLEEKSVEVSDQMVELIELNDRETLDISLVPKKEVILDEILENGIVEVELEKTGDATDESHESMEETSVISETSEDLPQTHDSIGAADSPSISEPEVSSSLEVEDSEPMETESTEKWVIKITVISVILAYMILKIVSFICSRKPSAKKNSVAFKKPSFKYAAKEKNGSSPQMLLKKEEINAERIEKKAAESYIKPSSSSIISGVQAPAVELVGEYVVEELNSSFKSCSLKPKTVQYEDSIFSMSKPRRMAFSSPANLQQPSFSAINSSSSYATYNPHERIGRKEVRDGEEVISTPLRRSSRLRSKSVMSP